jgi:hypothetical protein
MGDYLQATHAIKPECAHVMPRQWRQQHTAAALAMHVPSTTCTHPHISHLTSHISHLTSHISHLTSHISPCQTLSRSPAVAGVWPSRWCAPPGPCPSGGPSLTGWRSCPDRWWARPLAAARGPARSAGDRAAMHHPDRLHCLGRQALSSYVQAGQHHVARRCKLIAWFWQAACLHVHVGTPAYMTV